MMRKDGEAGTSAHQEMPAGKLASHVDQQARGSDPEHLFSLSAERLALLGLVTIGPVVEAQAS
jgi:hypothetical protein